MLLVFIALGCTANPPTVPVRRPADTTIGTLAASPRVVILAVGGTQQLGVNIASLTGAPVTSVDSVKYFFNSLADTVRLRVMSTGLATGLSVTSSPVLVNVFGFQDGAAKADQVLVQVTSTALSGLALSIQPVAPDSAKLAAGLSKTLVPILRNPTTGASVANPAIRYSVKLVDVARVVVYTPKLQVPGGVIVQLPPFPQPSASASQIGALASEGSAWIYGEVNAYGTILRDSVQYTFSYPYTFTLATTKSQLAVFSTFNGQVVTLAAGATVTFSNGVASTDPLGISYTFDNPTGATVATPPSASGGASGNVTTLIGGQTSRRQFLTPGTYHWAATATGGPAPWPGQTIAGTLVIKP